MAELRAWHATGKFGKMIPVRLQPGTDLMNGLKKVCEDNGVRHGALLVGIGSLQKVTFMILEPNEKAKIGAAYTEPKVIPGPIEILGVQGVIFESDTGDVVLHLHGAFCDKDGKVFGGHVVAGENPILATLDAVIGETTGVNLTMKVDDDTGLKHFSPEPL